jgi:tetratricopeptide (TPR) repeat protein
MGVVYLARDLTLGRLVALKCIAAHLLSSEVIRLRFFQEARTISALNHPNIATVYEAGEDDGAPFFALEYLSGGSMYERMAGQRMSVAEALHLATGLFEGLAHAHRRGVVHRDIKPANLLFSEDGTLKITDFGLSKLMDAPGLTQTGVRMGTVLYMPPEQAKGLETDQRADLFSAGAVLYEMLAGSTPFAASSETAVIARLIDAERARPIDEVRADVPEHVAKLLVWLLEKKPEERCPTAEDALRVLRAARSGAAQVMDAATVSLHGPVALPSKTRRLSRRAWLSTAAAALAIGTPAVWFWRRRSLPPPAEKGGKRWLVVLPFRNIGDTHGAGEVLSQGLMETLTSMLAQTEQFQSMFLVVPPGEVVAQNVTTPDLARRLFRAELVITGSVQRLSSKLRLTLNLVDSASVPASLLGSAMIDQAEDALNVLQDRALAETASLLRLKLAPQAQTALTANSTPVSSAYQCYLEARGYLQRYDRGGNLDAALALLNRAIELDPNYALAWAGLSEACQDRYHLTADPKWLDTARSNALHAVQLNANLPAAHINAGDSALLLGKAQEAVADYQNALRLDAANPDALRGLANAWQALHRPVDAEKTYLRSLALRPNDWIGLTDLGVFYMSQNRMNDAEKQFRAAADLVPDNQVVWRNLGGFYIYQVRYKDAEQALNRSIAIRPTHQACSNLATVLYYDGRYADAARMNERAISIEPSDYHVAINLADSYRWAPGEAEKAQAAYRNALALAERAVQANPQNATAITAAALCRAKLGETDAAVRLMKKALTLAPEDAEVQFQAAIVYALAGNENLAFSALQTAVRNGYPAEQIRREPELNRLRQDARFSKALQQGAKS